MSCFAKRRRSPAQSGSPLSPTLCGIAVAVHEQCWHKATAAAHLESQVQSDHGATKSRNHVVWIFATRLVDNRLTIFPARLSNLPPLRQVCHSQDYGAPIVLEYEPASAFSGFDIRVKSRRIAYTCPQSSDGISALISAAPPQVLASSLKARAHMARTLCHPATKVLKANVALIRVYHKAGYSLPWQEAAQVV